MATLVITKTWSDKPIRVVGSYVIVLFFLFVMIKSMHNWSAPLLKVVHAGGPGYRPFNISQLYYSQISNSQGARWFVFLSSLSRVVLTSSMLGDISAILVFQSPPITVVSCCGKHPTMSSTRLRVTVSSAPLFC